MTQSDSLSFVTPETLGMIQTQTQTQTYIMFRQGCRESDRGDEQVIVCKQGFSDELTALRMNQEKAMKDLFDNFEQKIVGMMNKFTEQLTSRLEKAENRRTFH